MIKRVMLSLLIISSLLLVITVFLFFKQLAFINHSDQAQGIVINFQISYLEDGRGNKNRYYHPIVKYINKEGLAAYFLSDIGHKTPQYELGEQVDVLYTIHHAEINSFKSHWSLVILLGILGIIPFLIAIGFFCYIYLRNKQKNWLIDNGKYIETSILSIETTSFLNFVGHSYVIYSEWVDEMQPDVVHIFRSENIKFNPEFYIKDNKTINVYIDIQKPRCYYMDIRFLPKVY